MTVHRAIGSLVAVVVGLVLVGWWSTWLTTAPARADALQNLTAGWNLARSGTFSTAKDGKPNMFREPLVPAVTAVAIRMIGGEQNTREHWASGERIRTLKRQNLVWMLLLCIGVWASARGLGASRIAAGASVGLVNGVAFILRPELVDTLGSDLAAAALLTGASGLLAQGWTTGRWRWWIGTGLVLGLGVLVKASLLYVTVGLALGLMLLAAWRAKGWPGDNRGVAVILMLLATAVVTTPWSERNNRLFGVRALTDRGGDVLLLRAYENQVTAAEYSGVWCAYAPGRVKAPICKLTGWSRGDLREGRPLGRFNRANPADPAAVHRVAEAGSGPAPGLSFYRTAKARFFVLIARHKGDPAPLTAADAQAKREALALIRANPGRHLMMSPAFLWRGLGGLTVWLGLVALVALARRRDDLAVFLTPSVGLGLFMALFSHFIPRYAWPMIPAACVILPLILEAALPARAGGPHRAALRS